MSWPKFFGVQTIHKTFDELRKQVKEQWLSLPPAAEVISPELRLKTEAAFEKLREKSQVKTE